MKYLLGIDVGTTGTKTVLFSERGEPVCRAYRAYPLITDGPGECEEDANELWRAVVETVREVTKDREIAGNVVSLSLSTQGGTLVPVDERGEPIRRAIVWNDTRCSREREAFISELGSSEALYQKTGWQLISGLPLLAIRYIKDNEPELFEKTAAFLSVPSFISMKLTGKATVDLSNLGIEQLADIRRREYDPELLSFAGVEKSRLADITHSATPVGNLTKAAAKELGLSESVIFVAGAHDQYAVALGAGAISSGSVLIGSGTCWVVTAIGDKEDFDSGFSQSRSVVPGLWGTLRSLSSGGICLEWLRNNIFKSSDGAVLDYETLNDNISKVRAGEDGLFFYPFSGIYNERDSFNKAAFVGMDLSHNRFHLARAVMEGVVFEILWMMEAFKTKPSDGGITLAGGASKSSVWPKILADASGLPIRIPEIADLSCVGAAIMAGVGAGLYADFRDACERFSVNESVVMPNPEMTAVYKEIFEKYKKQAEALGASYQT